MRAYHCGIVIVGVGAQKEKARESRKKA